MNDPSQERVYRFDAFFISLRTHFNFFRRLFTYVGSFVGLFTQALAKMLGNLPFLTPVLNLLSFLFDTLSFGSNPNHPLISNVIAVVGYSSLIILGIIGLCIPPIFSPLLVPALGLLLGLYFEGVTILNWFNNYKNLSSNIEQGEEVAERNIRNAKLMFYAAAITFVSILSKIIALSISTTFPAAALTIFIIAQVTEITAVFGSLGKEVVNFDRNMNYWFWSNKTTDAIENELTHSEKNTLAHTLDSTEIEQDSTKLILNTIPPANSFVELANTKQVEQHLVEASTHQLSGYSDKLETGETTSVSLICG